MNEEQEYNDHRLHIEPCPCGNSSPKVMGDDFDADVHCGVCGRNTPVCYGTKGAIGWWNENKDSLLPNVYEMEFCPEYIQKIHEWVISTKEYFKEFGHDELNQVHAKGYFAGWSERDILKLANKLEEAFNKSYGK